MKQQLYLYQVDYSNNNCNKLDIPFIKGQFSTDKAFVYLNVDNIQCDESIAVNEL